MTKFTLSFKSQELGQVWVDYSSAMINMSFLRDSEHLSGPNTEEFFKFAIGNVDLSFLSLNVARPLTVHNVAEAYEGFQITTMVVKEYEGYTANI